MNGRSFSPSLVDRAGAERRAARRRPRPLLVSETRPCPEAEATVDAVLARFDAGAAGAAAWVEGRDGPAIVAEGVAWRAPGADRGTAGWPEAAAAWRALLADGRVDGAEGPVAGPVLIGGAAFDPEQAPGPLWAGLGRGRLVLPRRMWTLAGGVVYETRNRVVGGGGERPWPAAIGTAGPGSGDGDLGEGEARFRARVEAARSAIAAGGLQKLVVARRADVASALMPNLVLRRLAARQADTFTFALGGAGAVFCGSTPELLARVRGDRLESVCLAGTAARGQGVREDRRLGAQLQRDLKEQEEHDLVRQGVRAALERTCRSIELAASPSLRALADVQHLASAVTAVVRGGFGLLDVAADLHPTPAVAGLPRAEATAWLRRSEGLRRGLYGGPVGYLTASGDGTFAVALRSGVLRPEAGVAHLFAGCGIVGASDAGREWQESRLKLRTMAAALEVQV